MGSLPAVTNSVRSQNQSTLNIKSDYTFMSKDSFLAISFVASFIDSESACFILCPNPEIEISTKFQIKFSMISQKINTKKKTCCS